jgi:predicted SAM-dependent methyltransferase
MIKEAYRVLKPGGYFCLDTPNRYLTEIHTKGLDFPYIHPEHKIEYYPEQLMKKLKRAGFRIIVSKGIKEMPKTFKSGTIDYTDFVSGKPLSDSVNMSYMQYYKCQKPMPFSTSKQARSYARQIKQNATKVKKALNKKA